MKYAANTGSGVTIHIPTFIKIGSGIQKLRAGVGDNLQAHRQHGDRISLVSFFSK
jgi:hypothetical protein